jgi:hypothetical protein
MAAAIATMEVVHSEGLVEQARVKGKSHLSLLVPLL